MKTSFIRFNGYLYKIKRVETLYYDCESKYQTVLYIFGDYYLYRRQRRKYFGALIIRDIPYILSDPRLTLLAAQFILNTSLFN
jgi:hypothetical protein